MWQDQQVPLCTGGVWVLGMCGGVDGSTSSLVGHGRWECLARLAQHRWGRGTGVCWSARVGCGWWGHTAGMAGLALHGWGKVPGMCMVRLALCGWGTGTRSMQQGLRGLLAVGGGVVLCVELSTLRDHVGQEFSMVACPSSSPLPAMAPCLSCRWGPSSRFPLPWLSTHQPLVYHSHCPQCTTP